MTDHRQTQRNVLNLYKVKCALNNCRNKPVSLFVRYCENCMKLEAKNFNTETNCIAHECEERTRSAMLNFCPEHTLIALRQLGVGNNYLRREYKYRGGCSDDSNSIR